MMMGPPAQGKRGAGNSSANQKKLGKNKLAPLGVDRVNTPNVSDEVNKQENIKTIIHRLLSLL